MPPKNILKLSESSLAKLHPWPKSKEELDAWLEACVKLGQLDYGKAIYALSLSALASFNYMASQCGVTGFQGSCAQLSFLARSRSMEGPFQIVDVSKLLYPQYDVIKDLNEYIEKSKPWLKRMAKKMLKNEKACPNVVAHWKNLAK